MLAGVDVHSDYAAALERFGVAIVDAWLVPPTAMALRVWSRLRLEIGETAIYTDGAGLGGFIGVIAAWRGALPVIRLSSHATPGDSETVSTSDPVSALESIRTLTSNAAGVAAVDLSGSGDTIALLLEALPRRARLMLAGPSPEPFTTEFYTDIHRKGALVCSAGDLDSVVSDPSRWEADVRNACRLLADPVRAARLRSCGGDRV